MEICRIAFMLHLVLPISIALGESSRWDHTPSSLKFEAQPLEHVLGEIEKIANEQPSDQLPARIIHDLAGDPSATVTLDLTNCALRLAIQYVCEVTSMKCVYIDNNALIFRGSGVRCPFRTVGLYGTISDKGTGLPITNATFASEGGLPSKTICDPKGNYVAAVQQPMWPWSLSNIFWFADAEDLTITIRAPGYATATQTVSTGLSRMGAPPLDVQLEQGDDSENLGPNRRVE
jgi:hypothetical protein